MRLTRFRFRILHMEGKIMYVPMEFPIAEDQDSATRQELCQVSQLIPESFVNIRQWQIEVGEGKQLLNKIQKEQSKDCKLVKRAIYHLNKQGKKQCSKQPSNSKMGNYSVETPLRPPQQVYIDNFGQLPRCSISNNCLLILADVFTPFCVLMTMKYMKAGTITREQDLENFKMFGSSHNYPSPNLIERLNQSAQLSRSTTIIIRKSGISTLVF
ncbi:hypothetical protein PR048_019551 [Dryococelus australis]|uniref:Uncharacterized protein n=1 Tax=Dryococelus australis TaxID=614101 RepID=A0ABQ9H3V2_9NEOP|nr:hypothetical protein PR048_019551 [Dryococelus australis]